MTRKPLIGRYWTSLTGQRVSAERRRRGHAGYGLWRRYVASLIGAPLPPLPLKNEERRRFDLIAILVDELNNALVRDLDLASALSRDLEMIILGSGLLQASERIRNVVPYTLILTLDRSLGNAYLLSMRLLYVIKDHAPSHERALDISLDIARNLSRMKQSTTEEELAAMIGSVAKRSVDIALTLAPYAISEIDLSSLDLSGRDLTKLALLDVRLADVMWTEATLWPRELADEIRNRSMEIWPGVFQIADEVPR